MHFGQTLSAGTVPEWKSRYVDYYQGKRLIGRLEKTLSSQLAEWDLPPPAQDLPEQQHQSQQPQQPQQQQQQQQEQQQPGQQPPQYSSSNGSDRSAGRRIVDELSPLLVSPISKLYVSPKDRNSESASGSIPMHSMDWATSERTAARKEFYAWLNAEVGRANEFYKTMEQESSTKLRLIRVQLDHFQKHRAQHHKERQKSVPKSATTFFGNLDLPTLPAVFSPLRVRNGRNIHRFSSSHHQEEDEEEEQGDLEEGRQPGAQTGAQTGAQIGNSQQPYFASLAASLPLANRRRAAAHVSDFNNKDDHVGYYQAKAMLRTALSEFYQSLLQLRAFRQMNETATRKIVKKFDKQLRFKTLDKYLDETHELPIRSSTELEDIIRDCEYLYADNFTKGNHKLAVDALNVRAIANKETSETSLLLSGFFLGCALPLLILALYAALHHRSRAPYEASYLLQMYGAFVLIGVVFLGFGFCIAIWSHYRINFPFIIELDRASMLNTQEYGLLPSLYFMLLTLCGWLSFNTVQSMHRYYPCVFLGIFVVGLIIPFGPYWDSRRWLLHSLWRLVFSGLYSVEFRDLLTGDVMCSLTYSLSTMELFFCVYATSHWWSGPGAIHAQRCTSGHSRALGFLQCLPGIWRFFQCWRRYADTLDWFPHLLNAGKYSFTILYYMSLSLARISSHDAGLKAMFIVFALINGLYTGLWDVFMDFSLSPTKELRSVLVYPKWTYWVVMVLDPLMRQNWILYVIFWNHKQEGAFISFIVALIEVLRRMIWVAFRVENEHAANINRCRAFKDLNLPYDDVAKAVALREELRQEQEEQDRRRLAGDDPSIYPPPSRPQNVHDPRRTSTFTAAPHPSSRPSTVGRPTPNNTGSPSLVRRMNTFSSFSPKIEFAHTNDFQRRRPKTRDEDEDDEDDEE